MNSTSQKKKTTHRPTGLLHRTDGVPLQIQCAYPDRDGRAELI